MRNTNEIILLIQGSTHSVIDNLSHESIDIYNYINTVFQNSSVTENLVFQFVFRKFYGLDNAGLTSDFRTRYFEILEEYRQVPFNFNYVLQELYNIPNRKNQNSFQFSFVSKMLNTIDNKKPIYDRHVAKVFDFSKPRPTFTFDQKLTFFMGILQTIESLYNDEEARVSLKYTIDLFDDKFANNTLTINKKLDFIFWSCGKILNKQ